MAAKQTWEERRAAVLARIAVKRDGTPRPATIGSVDEAIARYSYVRRNLVSPHEPIFPNSECCGFLDGCSTSENLTIRRIGMLFLLDASEYLGDAGLSSMLVAWAVGDLLDECAKDPDPTVQAFATGALSSATAAPRWLRSLRRLLLTLVDDNRVPTLAPGMFTGPEHPRGDTPRRWLQSIRRATRTDKGGAHD